MRRCALGKQQPHGIALIAEGGLHTQEDVAKLLAVDQEVLAIGVQLARWRSPVLMQVFRERAQLLVLIHTHAVFHIQFGHRHGSLWVFQDGLLQAFDRVRDILHGVALLFQLLHDCIDAPKDIQISSGAHIALVRGELEHANAQLLFSVGLATQVGPVHRTCGQAADTVLHRDGASTGAIAPREDQRFDGAVDLRQRHLQCHLHRVESQLAVLPLGEGLEDQWHTHHVGTVQLHQNLFGLLGVLRGRSAHQREARQIHQSIHNALAVGAGQVLLHGNREIQATGVGAGHTGTATLQLLDHAHVMAIILGGDVRLLQDQADERGVRQDAGGGAVHVVVPLTVLVHGIKDLRGQRMPNAHVWQHHRFHQLLGVDLLNTWHIATSNSQQHGLQVLGGSTQPVLQGEDEGPGVCGLLTREELEHLGQRPYQFQEAILEVATRGGFVLGQGILSQILHLLREVAQGATGDLRQVKGAQLVLFHHLGHGGEAQAGIQLVATRLYDLHQLLCQFLYEDQGTNKDVGIVQILGQLLFALGTSDLLQQISHALHADGARGLVDLSDGCGHRRLILRLQHNVDDLHELSAFPLLLAGHHTACRDVGLGVAAEGAARDACHHLILPIRSIHGLHVCSGHSKQGTLGTFGALGHARRQAQQGPTHHGCGESFGISIIGHRLLGHTGLDKTLHVSH
mmetsp:Transcript_74674/g.164876  ORF Transcript_74674/g.164876 Transcript_74674/m.164876 type:complete len:683 (+) Transcript_74674:2564-4612(+)